MGEQTVTIAILSGSFPDIILCFSGESGGTNCYNCNLVNDIKCIYKSILSGSMLESLTTLRNNTLAKIFSYHSLHQLQFAGSFPDIILCWGNIIVLSHHLMIFSTRTEVHLQGAKKEKKKKILSGSRLSISDQTILSGSFPE